MLNCANTELSHLIRPETPAPSRFAPQRLLADTWRRFQRSAFMVYLLMLGNWTSTFDERIPNPNL